MDRLHRVLRPHVRARARIEEQPHQVWMAVARRLVERVPAAVGARVEVRARVEEVFRGREAPRVRDFVDRTPARHLPRVEVRAAVHEESHDVVAREVAGDVERRALLVARVARAEVRAGVHQRPHVLQGPELDGPVELRRRPGDGGGLGDDLVDGEQRLRVGRRALAFVAVDVEQPFDQTRVREPREALRRVARHVRILRLARRRRPGEFRVRVGRLAPLLAPVLAVPRVVASDHERPVVGPDEVAHGRAALRRARLAAEASREARRRVERRGHGDQSREDARPPGRVEVEAPAAVGRRREDDALRVALEFFESGLQDAVHTHEVAVREAHLSERRSRRRVLR